MQYLSRNKVLALVLTASLMLALLVPSLAMGTNLFGLRADDKAALSQSAVAASPAESSAAEETVPTGKTTQATRSAAQNVVSVQADTSTQASTDPTVRYFPVTLYDYDETYNNAMHQKEVDAALADGGSISNLTQWNGMYFGGNGLGAAMKDGDAYMYEGTTYTPATVRYLSSGNYNQYTNGGYYYEDNSTKYLVTGITCSRSGSYSYNYRYSWEITCRTTSGTTSYPSSSSSITLYKRSDSGVTGSLAYANWSKWTGDFITYDADKEAVASHGNKTYSGLVENKLENGNLVFKSENPDAGIFDENTTVKKIYKNIGLPMQYDSDGYYTFDSDLFAAYFHTDTAQGTSVTPADGARLYYTTTKQKGSFNVQDGSTYGWFPFYDGTTITPNNADMNYFFGMRASVPFSMTSSGTISSTKDTPITFEFSGDDDVWVFIDGVLVLDIGGIHNKITGKIDFAANTWTISAGTEKINSISRPAVDVNNADLSGRLFNEGTDTGVLNQTRESFAAKDSHELTIFYLERGAGSSNCKIKFNLPQKDSLIVRKTVSDVDSKGKALADDVKAALNKQDFGFKLYKKNSENNTFEVVANADYRVYNGGNYVRTGTTATDGSFSLKNGESARFVGEISAAGDSYYVVEEAKTGFETPAYDHTSNRDVTTSTTTQDGWTSPIMTIKGTDDTDTLTIICTNTMTAVAELELRVGDERVVVDYGLPVKVSILENDAAVNGVIDSVTLADGKNDLKFGTAEIVDNQLVYTLTKQMHGIETITYTVTAKTEDGTKSVTADATVTVIPATTMYYEENFGDLVTYTGAWEQQGTATNGYQETGLVGGSGNSPYGSDTAYLDDSTDSNGMSMYVDTTDKAASFSYEFYGTGTTFFARTTENSGYMRVVVTNLTTNSVIKTLFRDTSYKNGGNIVNYNIPVYTLDNLDYGHYQVTVSIAKKVGNYGTKFWLDGIRIINPIDPNGTDDIATTAFAAYAADYEANNSIVTIREKLLCDATKDDTDDSLIWKDATNGFVLFTDSNGEMRTAEEYRSNGPKEEVYLNVGQSITFSLLNFDTNTQDLYIGLKAPWGAADVQIGNKTLTLKNTVDCFYKLDDDCFTISVDEGTGEKVATVTIKATYGLVSATNIKATGKTKFVIVNSPDKSQGENSDN